MAVSTRRDVCHAGHLFSSQVPVTRSLAFIEHRRGIQEYIRVHYGYAEIILNTVQCHDEGAEQARVKRVGYVTRAPSEQASGG